MVNASTNDYGMMDAQFDPSLLEGVERFNPEHLDTLEAMVRQSAGQSGVYDLNLNLAVLKLYQFNPSHINMDLIVRILLQSLTALPDNDFTLCLCLLTEQIMTEPAVQKITQLQQVLEMCDFRKFWQLASEFEEELDLDAVFYQSIRSYIVSTLHVTYSVMLLDDFCIDMNMSQSEALAYLKELKWTTADGSHGKKIINVPTSQDQRFVKRTVPEKLSFKQLGKVLHHAAV